MLDDHAPPVCETPPVQAAEVPDEGRGVVGPAPDEHSVLGLAELLLKNPSRVDRLARDESR